MSDDKVVLLVRGLCDTVPSFSNSPLKEEDAGSGGDPVSYDETLAVLLEMGYQFDLASRAIQNSGSMDVSEVLDYLNETSSLACLLTPEITVKLEEGECETPKHWSRPECSQKNKGKSLTDSPFEEGTIEPRRSLGHSESSNTVNKGKSPVKDSNEEFEDALDWERWEHDEDDIGDDKQSSLLRMGFSHADISDAIETCDEDSDVNHLANYIINKIVDQPNSNWEDEDWAMESMEGEEPETSQRKEAIVSDEDATVNMTDEELSVFTTLRGMGFSAAMISGAMQACGKDAAESVLVDYLLGKEDHKLAAGGETPCNNEELQNLTKLQQLKQLGSYSTAACRRAIDNNPDAGIAELMDYLDAEKIDDELREEEQHLCDEEWPQQKSIPLKRRKTATPSKISKKKGKFGEKDMDMDEMEMEWESEAGPRIHRNLKGFGLPGEPVTLRELDEDIKGPPYFYFENVAGMPKHEWSHIQRHLYNIAPEFVDSLNFSPCRRPRGYIHNLPVEGRVDILPRPPMTIQELFPGTAQHWPHWDDRVKLHTINTRAASDFVRRQIHESLGACERGCPSQFDIKTIMYWAKKWNLVWTRPGVLVPLSPEDIEKCLGFDVGHTRNLYSLCDRVRVLGNSFQVNTVAFHLSVLRSLYPDGIRVLSLFSGIGGAEVSLHKLGIFLKVVVSVEINDKARMVVDSWWKTTKQKGTLVHSITDVKELDSKKIQSLVERFGGFDLVIGGSPCNNLSGNNRCSRVGLAGTESVAFFEFPRILAEVRDLMSRRR